MIERMKSIQSLIGDSIVFLNKTVVPFLFALAFLFFIVTAARYFIIGGGSEDARKKARLLALWGIIAFVVMVSIWGIVNVLLSSLNISGGRPVCPDYLPVAECRIFQNSHQFEEENP